MASYSIWGVIRRNPDGRFRVRVRAIPLQGDGEFDPGDDLADTMGSMTDAISRRDQFVRALQMQLIARGDIVSSVDSTFET